MNSADGLTGKDIRFVQYNGALGPQQIKWLDRKLAKAEASGQKVIIISMYCFTFCLRSHQNKIRTDWFLLVQIHLGITGITWAHSHLFIRMTSSRKTIGSNFYRAHTKYDAKVMFSEFLSFCPQGEGGG